MSERFLCGVQPPNSVTCDTDIEVECGQDSAMDRKYPSYTLADLKKFVAEGKGNAVMEQEIKDRESGASVHKSTPQVEWKDVKMQPITIGRNRW